MREADARRDLCGWSQAAGASAAGDFFLANALGESQISQIVIFLVCNMLATGSVVYGRATSDVGARKERQNSQPTPRPLADAVEKRGE